MFLGLLIGLAMALGIALYLNKTPIPFASRAKPAEEDRPAKPSALAGLPQGGRITSYNVCYTKLLRLRHRRGSTIH